MIGCGFVNHLGGDKFEVSNEGVGRDFKKIQVKLLKKDMQEILKKYGRDNKGKKDEVILKFVEFIGKVPKIWKPAAAAPSPAPEPAAPAPAVPKPSTTLSKIAQAEARVNRMLTKLKEPIMSPVVSVPVPEEVKAPLSVREEAKAVTRAPTPSRPRYKHRFSDIGYNADRYTEDEIMKLMADSNAGFITEEERQIKRLAINKIINENRKKNKDFIGNWILNGERYNSKTGKYYALK